MFACGNGEQSKSGPEILADSLRSYHDAHSLRVSGHFVQGGHTYTLDLQLVRPDSVGGTVQVDGNTVGLTQVGNRTFLRGSDYIASVAGASIGRLAADKWLLYPNNELSIALAEFASANGIWGGLAAAQPNINKEGQTKVDGVDAIKLANDQISFYVASASPNYPVRVEGKGDPSNPTGIRDFALDFSDYGNAFEVAAPAQYIDFSNPRSLPAHFVVVSANIGPACGNYGCTLTAAIRNEGGNGTGRIVFHLRTPDGTEIGRCSSPIRGLAYGQSKTVACWAYNPDFQSYVTAYTVARFTVVPEVQNPTS